MDIKEYKNKNQVMKRLNEIKNNYLKHERKMYKKMMKEYKSGRLCKPEKVEIQVLNDMYSNEEVSELNAWLLGYKIGRKNTQKIKSKKVVRR